MMHRLLKFLVLMVMTVSWYTFGLLSFTRWAQSQVAPWLIYPVILLGVIVIPAVLYQVAVRWLMNPVTRRFQPRPPRVEPLPPTPNGCRVIREVELHLTPEEAARYGLGPNTVLIAREFESCP